MRALWQHRMSFARNRGDRRAGRHCVEIRSHIPHRGASGCESFSERSLLHKSGFITNRRDSIKRQKRAHKGRLAAVRPFLAKQSEASLILHKKILECSFKCPTQAARARGPHSMMETGVEYRQFPRKLATSSARMAHQQVPCEDP